MTLEDVMKLINAGYTKEEIAEFKALETGGQEPQEPQKPEPQEPQEPQEPETRYEHHPDEIGKLTEQVKTLTETMQKHFIDAAEKKTPVGDGTDVLKNILEKGAIN